MPDWTCCYNPKKIWPGLLARRGRGREGGSGMLLPQPSPEPWEGEIMSPKEGDSTHCSPTPLPPLRVTPSLGKPGGTEGSCCSSPNKKIPNYCQTPLLVRWREFNFVIVNAVSLKIFLCSWTKACNWRNSSFFKLSSSAYTFRGSKKPKTKQHCS